MTYEGRRNLNSACLFKDLAQGDKDQSCASLLSSAIDFLGIIVNHTQGEPTYVPFAVTRHIFTKPC